jgi:ArsR family transcriptional regulator
MIDWTPAHSGKFPQTNRAYIDNRRFSGYFYWIMSPTDAALDKALQAIADPTRRRILAALKERGVEVKGSADKAAQGARLCGGDIEERIRLSQPTISHHMNILSKAGLVEVTKQGQWRWYRRNEKAIREVVKTLKGKL